MRNSIYFDAVKEDKEKLKLLNDGIKNGLVSQFDDSLIIKLRNLYLGVFPGSVFIYMKKSLSYSDYDKIRLLTVALEDEDFKLVHGKIDSIRNTEEVKYAEKFIKNTIFDDASFNYNYWFEVSKGGRTWIYDLFSLLKFDKELYYKIENPAIDKVYTKNVIEKKFYDKDEDPKINRSINIEDSNNDIFLTILIPSLEEKMRDSEYYEYLKAELTRIKKELNYEQVCINVKKKETKKTAY